MILKPFINDYMNCASPNEFPEYNLRFSISIFNIIYSFNSKLNLILDRFISKLFKIFSKNVYVFFSSNYFIFSFISS